MRTTASYELFPDAPGERAMARARYLAREGRIAEAEKAYRDVLAANPDLKACWAECFELLRRSGRTRDALRLAEAARAQFGDSAFPLVLLGAALTELERYREALSTLEQAAELDPDLALVWHELGYAAFRLGDRNRALLALDRAFALEPHTETLRLRGRILRDAGRYQAAEVTYEGALATALLELARDSGWCFGQVVAVGPPSPAWQTAGDGLGVPLVGRAGFDPEACPLLVARGPLPDDHAWAELVGAVMQQGTGLVFVLEHPAETHPRSLQEGADVIGVLTDRGERRGSRPNVAHALAEAQHPAARLVGRRLRT